MANSYLGGGDLFRPEDIERTDSGSRFDVVMLGSPIAPGPFGRFDWTQQCAASRTDDASAMLGCRLGFYYSSVTGTAWCDGPSLVALGSAF
ncbi:MAG: hypothetical protein JXR83_07880 [Deltaproteobacteria bacterium]|nr:hypothetical protein [Deltaproteobacteria bacterium]